MNLRSILIDLKPKSDYKILSKWESWNKSKEIVAVVSFDVSMATNMKDWMVDSGATRHICGNRSAFTSSTIVKEGEEQVFIGSSGSSQVICKGKVLLKLTFGKVFALSDVLHVPDIHWKLESTSLFKKA